MAFPREMIGDGEIMKVLSTATGQQVVLRQRYHHMQYEACSAIEVRAECRQATRNIPAHVRSAVIMLQMEVLAMGGALFDTKTVIEQLQSRNAAGGNDDIAHFNWKCFGTAVSPLVRTIPHVTFMNGPIEKPEKVSVVCTTVCLYRFGRALQLCKVSRPTALLTAHV